MRYHSVVADLTSRFSNVYNLINLNQRSTLSKLDYDRI